MAFFRLLEYLGTLERSKTTRNFCRAHIVMKWFHFLLFFFFKSKQAQGRACCDVGKPAKEVRKAQRGAVRCEAASPRSAAKIWIRAAKFVATRFTDWILLLEPAMSADNIANYSQFSLKRLWIGVLRSCSYNHSRKRGWLTHNSPKYYVWNLA